MTKYDYLIIGNGIAGVTAAETIREHAPSASIAIIGEEPHILYSRVLIPAYLKKRIPREKLFLRKPDDFKQKGIDLFLETQVTSIDPNRHEVHCTDKEGIHFGKLLIATGGKVREWGRHEDRPLVYRLQTMDDADRLARDLQLLKQPLVIGASFISLEFLEIFALNNVSPTLLAVNPHFFSQFLDPQGGELFYENFERHGIRAQFNDSVSSVTITEVRVHVETKALHKLTCDSFAVGIGLDRSIEFLKGSDIEVGRGVRANEYLETNIENIYAAGDSTEFFDVVFEKYRLVGNWMGAFLQGKTAGMNMIGAHIPFRAVSTYSITNLGFQITALGDTVEYDNSVIRVDPVKREYERLFIKNDYLVGAALINRFQDKTAIATLIDKKIPIAPYHKNLRDFSFDIRTIAV